MDEAIKKKCEAVGLQQSLIFATTGLIAAALLVILMLGVKITLELLTNNYKSILIAVSALYISALILGIIAGGVICRYKAQDIKNRLVGIMLAESTLFISVLAGSCVEFFANRKYQQAFEAYLLKPLFWVMFLGCIPALILGIIYSRKVEKQIAKEC